MEGGVVNPTNSLSVDTVSILVVDDDITCLAIVAAILKKFKYEVVTVKHPNDALCTLRIKGGAFDLVVSDVHMPDMNGFELQKAIAREFNLPVVLMSADDKEDVALKGLECGAAFFIMKPISPDDLRDLWQFASLKRKRNQVSCKENCLGKNSRGKCISEEIIAVSESSVNEDATLKKVESKRKSPKKERFDDEKNGENSQSSSQKKPKIVWTNSLHNRFLEAIRSIGLERAVPKKILEVMNVPGLTRENVASHLQKYRIFLRRVSDASYKIQYSSEKGLSRNFKISCESPRTSSPSTLIPNNINFSYQDSPLPNLEASSSTGLITQPFSGQSRLLSNRGSWQKPSIETLNLISPQNNYGARASVRGHLANISLEDHSNAMSPTLDAFPNANTYDDVPSPKNIGDVPSSLSLKNLTYRTNCIGFKSFSESRLGDKYVGFNDSCLQSAPTVGHWNSGQEKMCDFSANYRMQLPPYFQNEGGIEESGSHPIFDLSELDLLSPQQALDQSFLGNNLQNQVSIQNEAQQNNGCANSNFYSNMLHWDNVNVPYSYDPIPNQIQNSQLCNSQGFTTSSQLNETAFVLPSNEQQVVEGLGNSLEFGTYTQLSRAVVSPTHEQRSDDDFLESLLAPFAEDHSLGGSNL